MSTNIENLRCGECGHKGLIVTDLKNWFRFSWRDFPNVLVTESLKLPTCPECKNIVINGNDVDELDKALEASVLNFTSKLLSEVMQTNKLTARHFARVLGLTPEYLSMLIHKNKKPSFALVQLLILIKNSPNAIEELKSSWKIA